MKKFIETVLGVFIIFAIFMAILQALPKKVLVAIGILIIVLVVVAVVLIIRWIVRAVKENKKLKESALHTQTATVKSEPSPQKSEPSPQKSEPSPQTAIQPRPSVRVSSERVYTDVRLFHPNSLTAVPDIGDAVVFAEDPENTHDKEAVAAKVFMDDEWQTVAYFNRNRLRDMVRDWLRDPSRGEIYAEVTKIEPRNVTVDITFTES